MSHNSQKLAEALEDYHQALARQAIMLRNELEPLQNSWGALSAVYEGTAAEQFRAGWQRTERMLIDYLETAERLRPVLQDRLDALQTVNRTDSELP